MSPPTPVAASPCSELIRLPSKQLPDRLLGLCRHKYRSNHTELDGHQPKALTSGATHGRQPSVLPLCQEDEELDGRWVLDHGNGAYRLPYTVEYSSWSKRCDEFVDKWINGKANAPDYLRYRWIPKMCTLASADHVGFCHLLRQKTLSFVGDSTNGMFFKSFVGMLFGYAPDDLPATRSQVGMPICGGHARLRWLRCDVFEVCAEDFERLANASDILVANWGVHYRPTDVVRQRLQQLQGILERTNVRPGRRVFWRASIAAHRYCNISATAPAHKQVGLTNFKGHHAADVIRQDREMNWPALRRAGVQVLRVQEISALRSDGHVVYNHVAKKDCLHYCQPGVPDFWVDVLYSRLLQSPNGSLANRWFTPQNALTSGVTEH